MRLKELFLHKTAIFGFLFLLFLSERSSAQNISNEGTDFWVCFPSHAPSRQNGVDLYAEMSVFITSKSNSRGKVVCGSFSRNFIVSANTVIEIQVPRSQSYISNGSGINSQKGIRITVDDGQPKVVAYSHVFAGARSAATLVLPVEALGQKYYAMAYNQELSGNNLYYSQFNIMAVDSNTAVKITPVINGIKGNQFSVVLSKPGDVYQYQDLEDISGSIIEVDTIASPCKRIAVFSGSTATTITPFGCFPPANNISADPLFQQLYPIESWGKTFALVPFYNRQTGSIYRFLSAEDDTEIIFKGDTIKLNEGQYYTTSPDYEVSLVKSDKPITVAQYALSQYCSDIRNQLVSGSIPGDPEMVILNPLEYSIDAITLYSSTKLAITEQYINVTIPTSKVNTFTLNSVNYGNRFSAIPDNTEFSYAQIALHTIGGSNFSLAADTGFSAIAYGFGNVESYAYSAGTSLASTKSVSVLKSGSETVARNACVMDSFDFKLVLPYLTDKLIWKLDTNSTDTVLNNPVYKIINSGDKELYEYRLDANKTFETKGIKKIQIKAYPPLSANKCDIVDEDVINFEFEINEYPLADISFSEKECIGNEVEFTAVDKSDKPILTWLWDFGDGSQSTEQSPSHLYKNPGVYNLALSVDNGTGCGPVVIEKSVKIVTYPVAKIDIPANACVATKIEFKDLSTGTADVDETINSWLWDFGDNITSTEQHPSHSYQTGGTYTVSLTVTNASGCADTYQQEIKINEPAEISFENEQSCVSDIVVFKAQVISGEVASWEWDFGDGGNDLAEKYKEQPQHKYASTGNYTVRLTAISTDGCTTVFQKQVTINGANPLPAFEVLNANSLCGDYPVQFKNNSTISFGNITKLEWLFDYGNGQQVSLVDTQPEDGKIYAHQYPILGQDKTYKVVLRAYSGLTCYKETTPIDVKVNGVPSLFFNVDETICVNTSPFKFDAGNQNTVPGTEKFEGRGIVNNIFYPEIAGPGTHEITYTFLSNKGCTDTVKRYAQVVDIPELDEYKEYDILLAGEKKLDLTQLKGTNVKYQWYPSEGLSADNVLNPVVSPTETTKYILTLTSGDGCIVSYDIQVNVHIDPFIPNAFSPNGDGYNDTWSIKYLETFVDADIRIFNRYGQEVFYSKRYTDAWDGRYKGKDVPVGVYYYIIEPNNGRSKYTGSVTLIR